MARPKMDVSQKRVGFHMLLHPDTIRRLDEYCAETGLSRTSVIEDAIIIHLIKNSRRRVSPVYGSEEEDRYAD